MLPVQPFFSTLLGRLDHLQQCEQGAEFNFEDTVRYSVTVNAADSFGASARATLTIDISDVNEPPEAANLARTVEEDGSVTINVILDALDPDADDTVTVAGVVNDPEHGSTTVDNTTGEITYTPAVNYHGADSFTYRVSDSLGLPSMVATVALTVTEVNDDPTFPSETATRTVSESAVPGDRVGAPLTATDIEDNQLLTYRLSGADAFAFAIDDLGQITVATGGLSIRD